MIKCQRKDIFLETDKEKEKFRSLCFKNIVT